MWHYVCGPNITLKFLLRWVIFHYRSPAIFANWIFSTWSKPVSPEHKFCFISSQQNIRLLNFLMMSFNFLDSDVFWISWYLSKRNGATDTFHTVSFILEGNISPSSFVIIYALCFFVFSLELFLFVFVVVVVFFFFFALHLHTMQTVLSRDLGFLLFRSIYMYW